jgi:hypothetical protein
MEVAHLLKHNMIQESSSPFAFPALLMKKKIGDSRLCVDSRKLNAYTVKNKYPLPIIEELFGELVDTKIWFKRKGSVVEICQRKAEIFNEIG